MIKIYPSILNGTLSAPASAQHAERLLFMSALCESATTVCNVPDCTDVDTVIECLKEWGCGITRSGNKVTVEPFPKNIPVQTANFDFKGSSTCCRIAIAISSALGIKANCQGSVNLQKRRLVPLTSRMALRGAVFSNFSLPCTMEGRLSGGDYAIDAEDGSQTVSALLMALPLVRENSEITITNPMPSDAFAEITRSSLEKFNIHTEKKENGYKIPGAQFYKTPGSITAENDWALSSLWITAAAACGKEESEVIVTDLPLDSPQKYRDVPGLINLLHYDFYSLNLDASNCPEIATLLAAMSIVKGATMEIKGVPGLKFKETDRLKTMADIARQLGQQARISDSGGSILILGTGKPEYDENTVIDCKDDPWVFISMVLASATMKIPLTLSDEHGADKIYKDFLKIFERLGGKFEIL